MVKRFCLKSFILITLALAAVYSGFADDSRTGRNILEVQEGKKAAFGLGAEWNMNSRSNFAGGMIFAFDCNINQHIALGLNATASYDFAGIVVIEPAALFRWYCLQKLGLYLQADLGAYLILEDNETKPMFSGGLRLGWRFMFGKTFFLEPYARVGYPHMFGVGAMIGVRFPKNSKSKADGSAANR